jgi:hypothetical protein
MTVTAKRRRVKPDPAQTSHRLLQILQANLAVATEAGLRERLQRAIAALKEKRAAA